MYKPRELWDVPGDRKGTRIRIPIYSPTEVGNLGDPLEMPFGNPIDLLNPEQNYSKTIHGATWCEVDLKTSMTEHSCLHHEMIIRCGGFNGKGTVFHKVL